MTNSKPVKDQDRGKGAVEQDGPQQPDNTSLRPAWTPGSKFNGEIFRHRFPWAGRKSRTQRRSWGSEKTQAWRRGL